MTLRLALTVIALAASLASAAPALAGTAIVNIQAFSDAGSTGSGVSNPDTPVGQTELFTNAVTIFLGPGDYTIADAWGQPGATYDAWNFQSSAGGSWTGHFSAGAYESGPSSSATYTLLIDGQIPPGTGHFGGWDTQAQASAAFLSAGTWTLHLTQATTVGFAAPDYYLPDNLGGISLSITGPGIPDAVPEPAGLAMFLLGVAAVGLTGRRTSRR